MSGISGRITGGAALQKRLNEIARKLDKKQELRAGFLEGGKYADGTSLPMVAAIQEFGAPRAGIPPRPTMRPTVAAHSSEWGDIIASQLAQDDYDVAKTLGQVGEVIKGEIQTAISEVFSPALSPVTLMLRKMRSEGTVVTGRTVGEAARRVAEGEEIGAVNTKPLVDSAFLLHHVAYEVAG